MFHNIPLGTKRSIPASPLASQNLCERSMKVSEELLSSWATSCLLSYRMNGLSETLNLLKSLCAEFTHVDRINVAYIPADFSAIAS